MLPFTTYSIPEPVPLETPEPGKWLWMIVPQPPTAAESGLLEKIAAALQADLQQDVFCLPMPDTGPISLAEITPSETRLIISFGIDPSRLGWWIDMPQPGIRFMETFTLILTLPVSTLSTHAAAKKDLWKAMQLFMDHHDYGK